MNFKILAFGRKPSGSSPKTVRNRTACADPLLRLVLLHTCRLTVNELQLMSKLPRHLQDDSDPSLVLLESKKGWLFAILDQTEEKLLVNSASSKRAGDVANQARILGESGYDQLQQKKARSLLSYGSRKEVELSKSSSNFDQAAWPALMTGLVSDSLHRTIIKLLTIAAF